MRIEHCFANGERQSDEVFLLQKKAIDFNKNKSVFGNILNSKNVILAHVSRYEKDKIKNL